MKIPLCNLEKVCLQPKDQIRRCLNQDPAISYLILNLLDKGNYPEALIFRAGGVSERAIVHAPYQVSFCIISCWIRV